jgi:RNA polymerase sigma-70 factor (ECF subfamily)
MREHATHNNRGSIGDVVGRYRGGDPAAAEELARRACRLALRTSAAILHSRDEAADVAQDVAVEVLCSLDRLRDPAAFDAWVHRITVRQTLRRLGRRRVARATETPLALLAEPDEPAAPASADRDGLIVARSVLAAALAQMAPRQRLALALRYVHDLSDAEIAAALDYRQGTVHALLSRGRAALRRDPRLAEIAPEIAAEGGSR